MTPNVGADLNPGHHRSLSCHGSRFGLAYQAMAIRLLNACWQR